MILLIMNMAILGSKITFVCRSLARNVILRSNISEQIQQKSDATGQVSSNDVAIIEPVAGAECFKLLK